MTEDHHNEPQAAAVVSGGVGGDNGPVSAGDVGRPEAASRRGAVDADSAGSASPLTGDDPRVLALFGDAHATVARFAALLADQGVIRGLIGPREVARLWERHLINSASVVPFLPASGIVIDVGSGAGLPGIVIAVLRPDLHVVLLEPMERRVAWLTEVVEQLGLDSVEVVRGRAEDMQSTLVADAVTARAVAPMDRLVGWTLPLLRAGGVLWAMKGQTADQELADAASTIRSLGGGPGEVLHAPTIDGLTGTTLIRVVRELVIPRPPVKPKVAKARAPKSGDSRGTSSQRSGSKGAGARVTGSTGTGAKGTGSKGTGAKGTGSKGTGTKRTDSRGAGAQGTGSKGTGAQGIGSRGAGSPGGSRHGRGTE